MPNETNVSTITRKCKDCKAQFVITLDEANWLKDRNLDLYKRCPACRARRREERELGTRK